MSRSQARAPTFFFFFFSHHRLGTHNIVFVPKSFIDWNDTPQNAMDFESRVFQVDCRRLKTPPQPTTTPKPPSNDSKNRTGCLHFCCWSINFKNKATVIMIVYFLLIAASDERCYNRLIVRNSSVLRVALVVVAHGRTGVEVKNT
jgi:hypothetical protein